VVTKLDGSAATPDPDSLSAIFGALADPTRRAILRRLSQGDASVSELARPFAMSLPAVSKHLRVLERAGLIRRRRQAQSRPCTLDAAPLQAAAVWVGSYREFWEGSLDRLDAYLTELQQLTSPLLKDPFDDPES